MDRNPVKRRLQHSEILSGIKILVKCHATTSSSTPGFGINLSASIYIPRSSTQLMGNLRLSITVSLAGKGKTFVFQPY